MWSILFLSITCALQVKGESSIGKSLDNKLNTIESNFTKLQAKYHELEKEVSNIKRFLKISCSPCKPKAISKNGFVYDECDCTNLQPKRDCLEFYQSKIHFNGLYRINDRRGNPVSVYCDQTTDGGGWTVFQRRVDGSVDFYRNWTEYRDGFGDVANEHWLGNENIHHLTSSPHKSTLLVNMKIKTDAVRSYWAKYKSFYIDDASENYKLHIADFTGNIEDRLSYSNGGLFTTKDRDNDKVSYQNCAQKDYYGKGAWWMRGCTYVTLNGKFGKMKWYVSNTRIATFSEMKIRRNL